MARPAVIEPATPGLEGPVSVPSETGLNFSFLRVLKGYYKAVITERPSLTLFERNPWTKLRVADESEVCR